MYTETEYTKQYVEPELVFQRYSTAGLENDSWQSGGAERWGGGMELMQGGQILGGDM